ncbi:MAG TPA: SDR family NAD(P)-dependent oxidoreductase [Polyangia bacterium]|nr:SDR family NAD(P)-dependent oxidoreductase [Polyangia bacterium]
MARRGWATRVALAAAFAYGAAKVVRRWRRADLRGEVAVIMGGSRGLGLLLARELAAAGCRLVIAARDPDQLRVAQHDLEARGAEVLAQQCDVGDRRDIDLLVAAAHERFGRIDVLVNVAGLIQVGPAESMTIDNFRDAFAVNFWGPLHAMDAVIAEMQTRGSGRIVNITSIGGTLAVPHLLPYVCAKAAAVALSDGLGAELAKNGIKVTTVVPGLMRTGSVPHVFFKGNADRELAWFRALAQSPITAMSARRAARRIVAAVARGDSQLVLTVSARAGRVASAVVPGFVRRLFALGNRLLSSGAHDQTKRERTGRELIQAGQTA